MELAEKKYVWDDFYDGLTILGVTEQRDEEVKSRKRKKQVVPRSQVYCPHAYLFLNFLDILNPGEKIKYRKCYLRRVFPPDPDVIILQDVKNLSLFLLTTPVSLQFVNFFHLEVVDRFLRALILYFQFYTEIWDEEIIKKRAATMKKAPNPMAGGSRIRRAEEMRILRCLLAREYCELVVGCDTSARFHHMLAGTAIPGMQSQGEKDLRIFEVLIGIAHRVVWIALKRKHFTLIEVELHRLFRTDAYNTADRRTGGIIYKGMLEDEFRILHGPRMPLKRKLLVNSALPRQLISELCDFRIVSLGLIAFESRDPRINYLKNALVADEENFLDLGIKMGILGHSREDYDIMLTSLEDEKVVEEEEDDKWERKRSSMSDRARRSRILEKKGLSMPAFGPDPEIPEDYPPSKISGTSTKKHEIRNNARKMWISRELERQNHTHSDAVSLATTIEN
ncbi:protein phosphatase 1 regulatory subunit 36 [Diachasma alloeum]|uniref:protein phosphatase 1 regulatory subunit 36 n=1 Tax=Diachasma alloeum TaxID=454923 RepID=UPI0007384ACB|nr:protein phosphatase 1 regulatory subunit 36 [Diachasma alloeum]